MQMAAFCRKPLRRNGLVAHSAFRIPHGQLVAPKSDEGGRELFSGIHFGMDDWGN
jgi:hypothetical protein